MQQILNAPTVDRQFCFLARSLKMSKSQLQFQSKSWSNGCSSMFSLFLLLLLSFNAIINVNGRTSETLKVKLPHGGVLVGRHLTTNYGRHFRGFMGIPYAKPPVGELRFKSPVPFGSWTGEMEAVKDSATCLQRDPFRRDKEFHGSEDCLYLNVYTPQEPQASGLLPVMVWFHGGGYMCGSGISEYYGPDFLLNHDIIYVSGNYRLGPLGFMSTETLDCPGNFGLKDQLEILKWIQQNIASFGGDPNSVTIFGESAGGASVTYHMMSPKSKGLFHKGIAQSGTYYDPWAQPAHKGVAATRAAKLAKLIGCYTENDWPKSLSCLRTKSALDISAKLYDFFEWDLDPMIPFPPVVEPKGPDAFLSTYPRNEKIPHGFSLPLMIGATSEEGGLKTASLLNIPEVLEDFKEKFYEVLPIVLYYNHHPKKIQDKITNQLEEFYLKNGHDYSVENYQNITDLITDGWFLAGIDEYLRQRLDVNVQKKGNVGPTYVYLFDHKGAASFTEIFEGGRENYYGVCHAEELQYLFPLGKSLFKSAVPSKADQMVRDAIVKLWVNFARASNPTPPESGFLTWNASKKYPVNYIRIGGQNENDWKLLTAEENLLQPRADFWYKLAPHVPAQQYRDEL